MNTFRPQFSGFGADVDAALPLHAAPTAEQIDMGIIANNADRIFDLIKDNGGRLTGEQLRAELEDLDAVDRRKALVYLKGQGKVQTTGATNRIVYQLAPLLMATARRTESAAVITKDIAEDRIEFAVPGWAPVCIAVPLVDGASPEVQLIAALDFIDEHFATKLYPAPLEAGPRARAALWLASKHQVAA